MPSLIAVAIALAMAAAPPVSVDTRVKISLSMPAQFKIRITVDPHPANRTTCLHWGIHGFYQKGCFNSGVRTEWKWITLRETGDWEVYATVERNDGRTLRSMPMRLVVRGPGYEEPADPFNLP